MKKDGLSKLLKTMKRLTKSEVLVGIPSGAGVQSGTNVPLALIGYVQEFGSPAKNIPPRPFLRPAVEQSKEQITDQMKRGAQAVLRDDPSGVENVLGATGLIVVSKSKAIITAGIAPALKPGTLYARAHRKDQPNNRETPLRDKDDLFKAITYVIRKKS